MIIVQQMLDLSFSDSTFMGGALMILGRTGQARPALIHEGDLCNSKKIYMNMDIIFRSKSFNARMK